MHLGPWCMVGHIKQKPFLTKVIGGFVSTQRPDPPTSNSKDIGHVYYKPVAGYIYYKQYI